MTEKYSHTEFAELSEGLAEDLLSDFGDRKNWVVTIRFYSFLHYVEKRLDSYGYGSKRHSERKKNIRDCRYIDNRARSIYRTLEDLSRDARYECHQMTIKDVEEAQERLEEGKSILNYTDSGSSSKYST